MKRKSRHYYTRKRIISAICCIGLLLSLCGCAFFEQRVSKAPELEDNQICFIYIEENYSKESRCFGDIITADGKDYPFDFSDKNGEYSLEEIYELPKEKGKDLFTPGGMNTMLYELYEIENQTLETFEYAKGMGSHVLYGVIYKEDGTHEIIKLGVWGDILLVPVDEHALELCSNFQMKFPESIFEEEQKVSFEGK